jgi:glycine/D-amino acid oxidase-like deaminating enzyme
MAIFSCMQLYGLSMSHMTGKLIADLICGRSPIMDLQAFRISRF